MVNYIKYNMNYGLKIITFFNLKNQNKKTREIEFINIS